MKLIVGLGNIGEEYSKTVHNAGFMVIDRLAEMISAKFSKRGCDADYAEVNVFGEKFILAKPRTYMNESGRSVNSFLKKFKIDLSDVLVINDDIDLEPGKIRIRKAGSAGTHNGLKSIIREVGSENFARIRVGVGKQKEHQDLADFVLSKMFMSDEQKRGLENATMAVFDYVNGKTIDDIMTKFNGA
ncbi:MAG: aminoacyl-tRNA hydrolase [Clostridia bacterium]|nr:aminoacyl-tRNA hydrolase [Clostridia bacterium]